MSASLSENALTILQKRYLARDSNGIVIETPDEMFRRVARHVASAETQDKDKWEEEFYQIMSNLMFLPNTPCLVNAGRSFGMMSACFTLPLEDSLDGIFTTLHEAISIQKMGGGCGYSFSDLRPKGDIVASTGHPTSGPIEFLKVFDSAMNVVRQGGVRNGANMCSMLVSHPDIEEFINCKSNEGIIKNFNISVCITDKFMQAVKQDDEFELINPRTGKPTKKVNARALWRVIIEGAWRNGEPGILAIDTINKQNPIPGLQIKTTNPCSEIPLPPYDSCNLGSINLNSILVKMPDGAYVIDSKVFDEVIKTSVRFLDDVITVNNYPLDKIAKMSRDARRIGLGIMGLADVLMLMKCEYDSAAGRQLAANIMKQVNETSHDYSRQLAAERGPFPLCDQSVYASNPIRNATLTTIAPTGSISTIAGCSFGCEPHFAIAYERHILNGKMLEINNAFMRLAQENGFWAPDLGAKILENGGILKGLGLPTWVNRVVRIASDVSPTDHVRMQAALQQHVDNGISKTVNAPIETTVEDVGRVFTMAYEMGCKGITFYREGSRQEAVLVKSKKEIVYETNNKGTIKLPSRDKTMHGTTHKVKTGHGPLYVTANRNKSNDIVELFINTNYPGELRCWTEFASKISSLALRLGLPLDVIVKAGRRIQGPKPIIDAGKTILSGPDAVAQILEEELGVSIPVDTSDKICPECHGQLIYQEGCIKCHSCGYTLCGG